MPHTTTREIFIPAGRGRNNEVYIEGTPYIAEYINFNNISRLKGMDGKIISVDGAELRAIIANDERNHQYYKDHKGNGNAPQTPPPVPLPPTPTETAQKLTTIDYNTLMQQEYAPLQFQISEILPEGIFILAGAPKIGKSWLVLDMCYSIATGINLWEYGTNKGEVLYIALEDNNRRLQDRARKIVEISHILGNDVKQQIQEQAAAATGTTDNTGDNDYVGLHFATSSKGLFDGLSEQIDEFMKEHPNTGLIAIDTLEHIRRPSQDAALNNSAARGLYSADYNDMQVLRAITDKYSGLTLLLIHHTRKLHDSDPLFTVTGSTGLTGAVDGIWVLNKDNRTENTARLIISNRDTKGFDFELELDKDNCKWRFLTDMSGIMLSEQQRLAIAINRLFPYTDSEDTEPDPSPPEWKGNATALVAEILKHDDSLTISERTIKNKLNDRVLQDLLIKRFDIAYKYQEYGRTFIFTKTFVGV